MKKQAMSLAVTAALLGGAVSVTAQQQSMYINEGGLGEVLVYPFYSAANGNDTYVQIVNTTTDVKAVKVRFIEARNSTEVLDFNLYLSPEDEWAGVITTTDLLGNAGAIIRTVDTSCTVPQLTAVAGGATNLREQAFRTFAFDADYGTPPAASTLLARQERTLEGYIEVIEMGQLADSTTLGAAAVHSAATGAPANCAALVKAWGTAPNGAWTTNPQTDLRTKWSGGGLYGYSVLINVDEGTAFGVDATAIDNFASLNAAGAATLHAEPAGLLPSLAQGTTNSTVFADGVSTDYTFVRGIDAVSSLFMTLELANDYVIDPNIAAMTDWVVTMPTKSFYTNGAAATAPFTSVWKGANGAQVACEPVTLAVWDREEAPEVIPPGQPGFSPAPPGVPAAAGLQLCTEVSVLRWGTASAVEASAGIVNGVPDLEFTEGWARLVFDNVVGGVDKNILTAATTSNAATGLRFFGLPVMGFAVQEYTNNFLDGGTVKANYEAAVDSKTLTDVVQ